MNVNLQLILPENTDSQALLDDLSGATVTNEITDDGAEYQVYTTSPNVVVNGSEYDMVGDELYDDELDSEE